MENTNYSFGDNDRLGDALGLSGELWDKITDTVAETAFRLVASDQTLNRGSDALAEAMNVVQPQSIIEAMATGYAMGKAEAKMRSMLRASLMGSLLGE